VPEKEYSPRRQRTLTDEDVAAISEAVRCKSNACLFTPEEVQFVRDWLDTAKTAKSEVVKLAVKGIFVLVGLVAGIKVAIEMGWFRAGGK